MTTKLSVFDPYTIDSQALLLAHHLPVGKVWEKGFSPTSDIGKFLRGLGMEFYRLQVLSQKIAVEMDIRKANDLIIEWEKSVGLPDSCFTTNISIEERRKQVEQKLSRFGGVQTAVDFVRVAAVFGYNVKIYPGISVGGFPLTFPIVFFGSRKAASHTIIVMVLGTYVSDSFFALPFPLPFSGGVSSFLNCIFRKLAPANVQVIVVNEGDL